MDGSPNGLHHGSIEALKSETIEITEPQFKFQSNSVVKQQEITPQPIIDPIEQGEANQMNSTFPSIQIHSPTFSQYDIAGTVPDKSIETPPPQPFQSAQSTAVSYEESLRSPLAITCEQSNGSLLHPLGGSSNQHLQSQGAHYGGRSAPISLPESAPLSRQSNSSCERSWQYVHYQPDEGT